MSNKLRKLQNKGLFIELIVAFLEEFNYATSVSYSQRNSYCTSLDYFQAQTMAFGQTALPPPTAAIAASAPRPNAQTSSGNAAAATLPYPVRGSLPVYPGLAEFMDMELSEEIIRENMPEYLAQNQVAVRPQVSEGFFFLLC